ncbi:MAG: PAS domain-containing protein [Alphaproteobacteria bacterium]|nr:PAS domain-containing protein [Alphaproteobacteria bacterium]
MGAQLYGEIRRDPVLGPALAYWERKCGSRLIPARRDIDATEIPPSLLPYLQITERVESTGRIRYRLVGTGIVEAYGADLTGKYMDEIYSGQRLRYAEANYRAVCESKSPVLVVNRYHSSRPVSLVCHRLLMPLAEDGTTIRQFLTAMRFEFPGDAIEWRGAWFGNSGNFDYAHSYSGVVKRQRSFHAAGSGFDQPYPPFIGAQSVKN